MKFIDIEKCSQCPHYSENTEKCEFINNKKMMPDIGINTDCPLPDMVRDYPEKER